MTACHCHGRECENMDQLKNCGVVVDLSVDGDDEALLDIGFMKKLWCKKTTCSSVHDVNSRLANNTAAFYLVKFS